MMWKVVADPKTYTEATFSETNAPEDWVYGQFSNVVLRVVAWASPEALREMQILGPHLRLPESEILGIGPPKLCFDNISKLVFYMLKFENH